MASARMKAAALMPNASSDVPLFAPPFADITAHLHTATPLPVDARHQRDIDDGLQDADAYARVPIDQCQRDDSLPIRLRLRCSLEILTRNRNRWIPEDLVNPASQAIEYMSPCTGKKIGALLPQGSQLLQLLNRTRTAFREKPGTVSESRAWTARQFDWALYRVYRVYHANASMGVNVARCERTPCFATAPLVRAHPCPNKARIHPSVSSAWGRPIRTAMVTRKCVRIPPRFGTSRPARQTGPSGSRFQRFNSAICTNLQRIGPAIGRMHTDGVGTTIGVPIRRNVAPWRSRGMVTLGCVTSLKGEEARWPVERAPMCRAGPRDVADVPSGDSTIEQSVGEGEECREPEQPQ